MTEIAVAARKKGKTRRDLLEAGTRLVLSGAPAADITSRLIAKEADVNHALIAYHFGGMSELLSEVYDSCIATLSAEIKPVLDAFVFSVEACHIEDLELVAKDNLGNILKGLSGEKSLQLLRAIVAADTHTVKGIYGRFSDVLLSPLFAAFTHFVDRQRGEKRDPLETAVLAQLMVAQCMAFFRSGMQVKKYLGWDEITPERQEQIAEIVARSVIKNVR